jgi:hypothetical protein
LHSLQLAAALRQEQIKSAKIDIYAIVSTRPQRHLPRSAAGLRN